MNACPSSLLTEQSSFYLKEMKNVYKMSVVAVVLGKWCWHELGVHVLFLSACNTLLSIFTFALLCSITLQYTVALVEHRSEMCWRAKISLKVPDSVAIKYYCWNYCNAENRDDVRGRVSMNTVLPPIAPSRSLLVCVAQHVVKASCCFSNDPWISEIKHYDIAYRCIKMRIINTLLGQLLFGETLKTCSFRETEIWTT